MRFKMIANCELISKLVELLDNKSIASAFGKKSWAEILSTFKSHKSLRKAKKHRFVRNPVVSMKNRGRPVINPLASMTNLCRFAIDALALTTNLCRFVNDPVRLNTKPYHFIAHYVVGTIKRCRFNINQTNQRFLMNRRNHECKFQLNFKCVH